MKLSEAEWTVMNALWEDAPASARDVLEKVENKKDWAYTTVKTVLARLAEKGAVTMRKRANTCLYDPAITKSNARISAVRSLVERAFDGTFGTLVHHLLAEEKLSKSDRAELAKLIDEHDRKSKGARP